mmetsp:Transcript_9495/g.23912  ORF Transcript_9495/g.23912 Transcript_9495/m.23912 type:complete len:254 (+) Transcript_9495:579-1340(+)
MPPMKTAAPPAGPPCALKAAAEMKDRSPISAAKTRTKACNTSGGKMIEAAPPPEIHAGSADSLTASSASSFSSRSEPSSSMFHASVRSFTPKKPKAKMEQRSSMGMPPASGTEWKSWPMPTASPVITASAAMAPPKVSTFWFPPCPSWPPAWPPEAPPAAKIAAMKKVLSPISDTKVRRKACTIASVGAIAAASAVAATTGAADAAAAAGWTAAAPPKARAAKDGRRPSTLASTAAPGARAKGVAPDAGGKKA